MTMKEDLEEIEKGLKMMANINFNKPMKDQLETEKQANIEKIKAEEQAIEEMERIFKHAKFEKTINISRLKKANKGIDDMINQLSDGKD